MPNHLLSTKTLFLSSSSSLKKIFPSNSPLKLNPRAPTATTRRMSVATSYPPCLKIPTSSSSSPSPKPFLFTVRSSQTEGPLRRPATPPLRNPSPPSPPKPVAASPPPAPAKTAPVMVDGKGGVTVEFQRQVARELQQYFKQKKVEEANQGPFFGFIAKNEISNGRWAMFGFAVGLLTEYATGSDFVDQVKILLSNFGIVDLD